MPSMTITDYLKYANLQMAAEAFIRNETTGIFAPSGQPLIDALKAGNLHASRFTETQATDFAAHWIALDQRANTATGFSGTLFKCILDDPSTGATAGELVISFRSTEFIDDAVRDNLATNSMEIKNTGWAWGQISDMEAWYRDLNQNHLLDTQSGDPAKFAVTGYSLGGHLATAFNLLHGSDTIYGGATRLTQVVTFNGAGVGKVNQGTLSEALSYFNQLRGDTEQIVAGFTSPALKTLYRQLVATTFTKPADVLAARQALARLYSVYPEGLSPEATRVWNALGEIKALMDEGIRITQLKAGGDGSDPTTNPNASPKPVAGNEIVEQTLNYRMAVLLAGQRTQAVSLASGAIQGLLGKSPLAATGMAPQYDVVGDTMPSVVANSQWHYGQDVRLFIEDQPLYRGTVLESVLGDIVSNISDIDTKGPSLLVNEYAINDFGDTHSLVLIVDSLSLMNTFIQLDNSLTASTAATTTCGLLDTSSAKSRRWRHGDPTATTSNDKVWRIAA